VNNEFSVASHWPGDFDETGLRRWAENLRAQLEAPQVSLGLVFMTPKFFPHAEQVLEILRVHAKIPLLAGCSSSGLIVGAQEIESAGGLVLALYSLPGAVLRSARFTQEEVEESDRPAYWHLQTEIPPARVNGWLVFADPFHLDSEKWLRSWNEAYPHQPIFGGMASGTFPEPLAQVYLDGEVFEDGGVAIGIGGDVTLAGVISQGCTPIGDAWTLTRVERNWIQHIGNRPAYDVLEETFQKLPVDEQRKTQGNLCIGLAVNEYLEDFQRGDFLVRNLISADIGSRALAVGALPRAGQTMQFQRRDAAAATEDMNELLARAKKKLGGATIYGGCLCCCNGRGKNLFKQPNHDTELIQQQLGPFGLAGFFGNGEIGPVGEKNFLHSYTASLALFVKK
jgi:small ligand-binding sensory domain FIST